MDDRRTDPNPLAAVKASMEDAVDELLGSFFGNLPPDLRAGIAPLIILLLWDVATERLTDAGDPGNAAAILRDRAVGLDALEQQRLAQNDEKPPDRGQGASSS